MSAPRERIIEAAASLLRKGGREAVSTRAVSAEAGVQPPAIYRQFGDMDALLEEAAREILAAHVRHKAKRARSADPIEDLRRGWDEHIAFGLANPDAYAILYRGAPEGTAAREGFAMLEALLTRVAETGRLRMNVGDAAQMMHAAAKGVVFSLMTRPDPRLSENLRETVIGALVGGAPKATAGKKRVAPRAIALRAVLPEAKSVTPAERQLLGEWLDRLAKDD